MGSTNGKTPKRILRVTGEISSVTGTAITARLPRASVGDFCTIHTQDGISIPAQVVSFREALVCHASLREPNGLHAGALVETYGEPLTIPVGNSLLGRVVDVLGQPIDQGKDTLRCSAVTQLHRRAPEPMQRPVIERPLITGIRAIDGFCTLGQGQRIGIFASAGVGKSMLLGMLARRAKVDAIVVALVGERGREVREFTEAILGHEGLCRSVVVVATSNEPSLVRQIAPYTATAIAEYFRDQGKHVLLIIDSLTRTARAIRETSLAAGELPVRHGYTASVYTEIPKLLERAGTTSSGSITAIYTVLTNEEDDIDPLADEIKSLIDGHLILRKDLASKGILPAIDVTQSISRLFTRLHSKTYLEAVRIVVSGMSRLFKEKELLLLGGQADEELSIILTLENEILRCIRQSFEESTDISDIKEAITSLAVKLKHVPT